jgi:photosystem II stability/assembly factor-like uncharacterized protein
MARPQTDLVSRKATMTAHAATAEAAAPDLVSVLAASPQFAHDGICFAAQSSGLYRSNDGGWSWRRVSGAFAPDVPLATMTVAVSPTFASDVTVFAGASGGVLRSEDGGATWQIAQLPEPAPFVTALAISPEFDGDGTLFAGTLEDGVFRSEDRGRSWHAWNFGLLDPRVICLTISSGYARDETLFAGTGSGLFRSTNGGRSWRELALPAACAPVLSLALSAGGAALFAGTEGEGCFVSWDGGAVWAPLGGAALAGAAVNAIVPGPEFPASPELLVLLDDTLLLSRDGGVTWAERPHWPGVAAVLAPQGLGPDAPLLVGSLDGLVTRL